MAAKICPRCGAGGVCGFFECVECGEWLCCDCFGGLPYTCRACSEHDPQARDDRIADGEMTPADGEWLQCSAEEQGEDR